MRTKKIALIFTVVTLITSCSSSRPKEDLDFLVSTAELTGSIDGKTYDYSYGQKSIWCMEKSREYIAIIMGFDGTNGTDDMGSVQIAYYRACINSY